MATESFATRLLRWFDRARRDLPWRRDADPWRVWVSEVMLQQTRVEAVRKIYPGFLDRYPTPADLAAAGDDELLAAWRGLGYYRRARLLRDGARRVLAEHGGEVPSTPEDLAALPGIGEYTCGAVASIAFGHPLPAVDGNVERVLARYRGIQDKVKVGPGKRTVRNAVVELQDRARPGDFNQALMELGATVCTPRSPRCDACPVATDCVATGTDLVDRLPILPERRAQVDVLARAALVVRRGGAVVGFRVPDGAVNAGQVDLPGPGPLEFCSGADELAGRIFERWGAGCEVGEALRPVRHGITHHRILLTAHQAKLRGRVPAPLLVARPDDDAVPWTTLARKVFRRAGLPTAEG